MFTQDYSALGEPETNWWLTHLEQSHGAAWHPFPWVIKRDGAQESQSLKPPELLDEATLKSCSYHQGNPINGRVAQTMYTHAGKYKNDKIIVLMK
jgi:hypothetical protein